MVAVGMNKAADEFLILDERTREDLASGKYHDQRRGILRHFRRGTRASDCPPRRRGFRAVSPPRPARIAGPAFIFPRHRAPPVDPTAAKARTHL